MAQLITLDTLVCSYGQPRYVDGSGVQWFATEITGWFGSPGRRTAHTARSTADGALRAAAYRDTRTIELTGMIIPVNELDGYAAALQVAALCPEPGERYMLSVGDPYVTLVSYVEQAGPILCDRRGGAMLWDFSIPLVSSDPYRYSEAWVSVSQAGGADAVGGISTDTGISTNSPGISTGTAATPALVTAAGSGSLGSAIVYEVTGPTNGVQIADLSSTSIITVAGGLDTGDSIFINCSPAVAYDVPGALIPIPPYGAVLGSGSARGAIAVTGGWPTLPAGASHSYLMTGAMSAGSSLSVHTRGIWA